MLLPQHWRGCKLHRGDYVVATHVQKLNTWKHLEIRQTIKLNAHQYRITEIENTVGLEVSHFPQLRESFTNITTNRTPIPTSFRFSRTRLCQPKQNTASKPPAPDAAFRTQYTVRMDFWQKRKIWTQCRIQWFQPSLLCFQIQQLILISTSCWR